MAVEDLKWLGLAGICIEACRIILLGKRLFTKITFALILPLCLIFMISMEVSQLIAENIHFNKGLLQKIEGNDPLHDKLADFILSKETAAWAFGVTNSLFVLMISLLASCAVVYTTAHIYITKEHIDDEISFSNVMYIVPKVWSRLIITFLWYLLFVMCYATFTLLITAMGQALLFYTENHMTASSAGSRDEYAFTSLDVLFLLAMEIVFWIGFTYISAIWHLASVVTILEDVYGKKAMKKSLQLIKGKRWISYVIVSVLYWFLRTVGKLAWGFVQSKYDPASIATGIIGKMIIGTVCLLFLLIAVLLAFVIIAVHYFVCKSYHNETIDRTSLECRLKAYRGEYAHQEMNTKPLQYHKVEIA